MSEPCRIWAECNSAKEIDYYSEVESADEFYTDDDNPSPRISSRNDDYPNEIPSVSEPWVEKADEDFTESDDSFTSDDNYSTESEHEWLPENDLWDEEIEDDDLSFNIRESELENDVSPEKEFGNLVSEISNTKITDDSSQNLKKYPSAVETEVFVKKDVNEVMAKKNKVTKAKSTAKGNKVPAKKGNKGKGKLKKKGNHTGVLKMSHIRMPTGNVSAISIPPMIKGWKCNMKTKLITLNPNGKMGKIEYNIVTKEMMDTKKNYLGENFKKYNFIKIQKVVNPCLWKKYIFRRQVIIDECGKARERMLFHGSPHIKEVLEGGFDERHANPKGFFGAGLYFAKNSTKSNKYAYGGKTGCPKHNNKECSKCTRRMLLCRVTHGNIMALRMSAKLAHAPQGCHSVVGLRTPNVMAYQEHVVYRGEQDARKSHDSKTPSCRRCLVEPLCARPIICVCVYPEFLITYKIVK